MEKTAYLIDGQEIKVIKKIDGGYLVQRTFDGYYDDETGSQDESFYGPTEFVDNVFTEPPTERLAKEVVELQNKLSVLQQEVSNLDYLKSNEKKLLSKALQVPGFQMVLDYINNNFKYYVDKDLEVIDRDKKFKEHNICIEMVKGEIRLSTLSSDYFGSDRRPVNVFTNKEDADAFRKQRLLDSINSCRWPSAIDDIEKSWHLKDVIRQPDIQDAIAQQKALLSVKRREEELKDAREKAVNYILKIRQLGETFTLSELDTTPA
jgi:DNA-binding transcriptional MerR regulator